MGHLTVIRLLAILAVSVLVSTTPANAAEPLPGLYPAELVDVIDGDTLKFKVLIWVNQTVDISVRLHGVDTPELKGQCALEREKAKAAQNYVKDITHLQPLALTNIRPDKYGGRVVGSVLVNGKDLGEMLIQSKLARTYDGGKRQPWCGKSLALLN